MLTRPAHILPSELDIRDPGLCAQRGAWTGQMQCEMTELVARAKATIATSRELLKELDRVLASR